LLHFPDIVLTVRSYSLERAAKGGVGFVTEPVATPRSGYRES
jgi:hypothetical protein